MEEPVDTIRECSRAALTVSRRAQRDDETNSRRQIVNENITPAVITDITKRLQTKSAVSTEELRSLKNSILDDPHHIEVVLNSHGAVRGLVRELTGQDSRRALQAAGCLCNLSLGDGRACAAVARAAGPYLIAALHSLHTELATTCAWAVGNAAGGGAGAGALLAAQGAPAALLGVMTSREDDVGGAAAAALAQLVTQLEGQLRKEQASSILQALSHTRFTQPTLQLLFILSCRDDFDELMYEELLLKLLEHSRTSMESVADNMDFVYAIRTLANITLNEHIYSVIVSHFSLKVELLKMLLMNDNDNVVNSLLWFLGNLFNYNCDNELFNTLLC